MTQSFPFIIPFLACITFSASATAIDLGRDDVRDFIAQMSREHDFDRESISKLLADAEVKPNILEIMARPAERVVPWHEYRQQFLNERRIGQGVQFRSAHAQRLGSIDDPLLSDVIVGILGVETSYGRVTGKIRVLDALTTLAFDYPPRAAFFRGELQEFLLLTRDERIDPRQALGSYAGAMGSPQFIPSSYRNYAVDADGDGRRDLWKSWDDVIASVANYLHAYGWRDGEPVCVPATLPSEDLSAFNVTRAELNESVQSLRDKGVQFETDRPADSAAMLIVAQGKNGPEYRVGFHNFFVITRYNRSTMYAMAVHDLGRAVRSAAEVKR